MQLFSWLTSTPSVQVDIEFFNVIRVWQKVNKAYMVVFKYRAIGRKLHNLITSPFLSDQLNTPNGHLHGEKRGKNRSSPT